MEYQVLLTDRAIRDLESARSFIEKFAPETAERWYQDFLTTLLQLEKDPESRPLAPESTEFPFPLRQFFVRTKSRMANRALFIVVGDEVRILAVRRPGQPLATAKDLK